MNPLDASLADIIKCQKKTTKYASSSNLSFSSITSNTKLKGKGKPTPTSKGDPHLNASNGPQPMKRNTVGRKPNPNVEETRVKEVVNRLRAQSHQARSVQFMKNRGLPAGRPTANSISKRLRPAGSTPLPKRQVVPVPPRPTLPPPQKSITFTFTNDFAMNNQQQHQQQQHNANNSGNSNNNNNHVKAAQTLRKGKQPQNRNNSANNINNNNNQPRKSRVSTIQPIHSHPTTLVYQQPMAQQPVVTYQTMQAQPQQMDFQFDTISYTTPGAHLHPAQVVAQPVVQHQPQIPVPPRPRPIQQQPVQVVMAQPVLHNVGWHHAKIEPGIDYGGPSAYDNATQFMSRMGQMTSRVSNGKKLFVPL
ncbi:hypothetical protein SeMB42_g03439 [Synchytrium endobioticum]|uniref:Uncharacterized protein n=1 Tax=Synchytrium endobioticum TaxID=286115 RepID=A0A507D774_9FUNG|nr:hypothetical protein SeLEV6574_g04068 [Synchytrium endobioticum]TPX47128.1 hypothetical protein SeMB42_g03441 [Synchytrium endobioticum]TPX47134.1 hypothetical protein SeMB42_g03439 [Synchytrium endobioticum]